MKRKTSKIVAIAIVLIAWLWISVTSLIGESTLITSYPKVLQIVLLVFAGVFYTEIFIMILATAVTTVDTEETKNIQ